MKNITKIGIAVIILAIIAVSILAIRGSHRNAPIESESEPVVTVTTVTSETTSSLAEKTTTVKSTVTKAADTTDAVKSTPSSKSSEAAQTQNKPAETKAATVTKAAEKKDNSDSANKSDTETQKQDEQNAEEQAQTPISVETEAQTMDPAEAERRALVEEEIYYKHKKDYTKEDMFSDNAFEAEYAMDNLCIKFSQELFNGHSPEKINGGTYRGLTEAGTLLVTLNYGQNINELAMGDIYINTALEDFQNYSDAMNLAYYQYAYGSRVDFNNYIVDNDLANFLNRVTDEYIEYMNGNTEPLTNEMNSFFENNAPEDNYIKYYFMRCTQNPYDFYAPEIEEARQMYYDNVVSSIYYQFEPEQEVLARRLGRR